MKRLMLLVALLAAACSRPGSDEAFVRTDQRDEQGRYAFTLAMDDSLATYDITVYAAAHANDRETLPEFVLGVEWEAPSGQPYYEQVRLGPEHLRQRLFFAKYLCGDLRREAVPAEWGIWKLYITVADGEQSLDGLGIRTKRNYGSR
ncbi:MAG: hypothetical protein IJ652_03395 [Bacteroidales bacterium]|nr:hypothetical protein [Bacteroidales bacterium]